MKSGRTLAILFLLVVACPARSQTTDPARPAPSAVSQQPSGNPEDQRISADLKRYLLGDVSLSEAAKGIAITTLNQIVTLVGEVPTQREKNSILAHVRHAGALEVRDKLVIKQ